ncbi:MAG: class I SAM-dependent methyltransferase [Methanophagales archaeon ANME-1-THS]|nr:MAG: class I SAM-dependent methyltransferase [Methanophagales archaeon ANME-1-THS]
MNPGRVTMEKKLYHLPGYYDLAFSYDASGEINFFSECFKRYTDFEMRRILKPACGSGRLLIPLAQFGYYVVGYDISEEMVAYTRDKIAVAGLSHRAEVVLGDMRTARFKDTFDAAINLINTIGYLISDEDILNHFRAISYSLRTGGIYIVELSCANEKLSNEERPDDTWIAERDGIKIQTTWHTERYDLANKRKYNLCKMKIEDEKENRRFMFIEPHIMRLWFFEDFKLLSRAGGFTLRAIYNQNFEPVPLNSHICGDLGNLYFILKKEAEA